MSNRKRTGWVTLAIAAGLGVAACGAGDQSPRATDGPAPTTVAPGATTVLPGTSAPAGPGTQPPASAPTAPSEPAAFPAIDVVDVATGQAVNLSTLTRSDRPTLVWLWAPH